MHVYSEGIREASAEFAMYMLMYTEKNAGQNRNKIEYIRDKLLVKNTTEWKLYAERN
jgi:hypothetical protein